MRRGSGNDTDPGAGRRAVWARPVLGVGIALRVVIFFFFLSLSALGVVIALAPACRRYAPTTGWRRRRRRIRPAGRPHRGSRTTDQTSTFSVRPCRRAASRPGSTRSPASRRAGVRHQALRAAVRTGPLRLAADPLFSRSATTSAWPALGLSRQRRHQRRRRFLRPVLPPPASSNCGALDNFWRSLSNLTIGFPAPKSGAPCQQTAECWAASQASPVRRASSTESTSLMDYCSKPGYASGGFIADSKFSGHPCSAAASSSSSSGTAFRRLEQRLVESGFLGDVGAPAQNFGMGGPYTTLAASPVTAEEPFLRMDSRGNYTVFVPAARQCLGGPSWASGLTAGHRHRNPAVLHRYRRATRWRRSTRRWPGGKDLILTPGVYNLRPDHRGHPAGHGGARPRLPHPGAGERHRRRCG